MLLGIHVWIFKIFLFLQVMRTMTSLQTPVKERKVLQSASSKIDSIIHQLFIPMLGMPTPCYTSFVQESDTSLLRQVADEHPEVLESEAEFVQYMVGLYRKFSLEPGPQTLSKPASCLTSGPKPCDPPPRVPPPRVPPPRVPPPTVPPPTALPTAQSVHASLVHASLVHASLVEQSPLQPQEVSAGLSDGPGVSAGSLLDEREGV